VVAVCDLYAQAGALAERGIHLVSTDEKTGIQALERLHPDIPRGPGRVQGREHEYQRHGTLCLTANLEIWWGWVMAPTLGPTRTEADFVGHVGQTVAMDPLAGWVFIEMWFSILVRKLLRRASFGSVEELRAKIVEFIEYFSRGTTTRPTYYRGPVEGVLAMRRTVVSGSVFALLGLLAFAWAGGPEQKPPPAKFTEKAAPAKGEEPAADWLVRRRNFPGFDDPKTMLYEALDSLTKQYGVAFDVNERGFKWEQVNDVLRTEIAQPNPIPEMKNARLDMVLRKILGRVPVPSGATYLVRREAIEITTGHFQRAEIWSMEDPGPFLPPVSTALNNVPLGEALKVLGDRADYNVVLDSNVGEKAKTSVTATLYNVPLDTAVRLAANMADLRVVQVDNVLYVTTKERAESMEAQAIKKELRKKGKDPLQEEAPGWGVIRPGGGLFPLREG
jgi:hypothetical protein